MHGRRYQLLKIEEKSMKEPTISRKPSMKGLEDVP